MEQVQLISCIRFSMQLLISESVFMIGMKRKKNFGVYLLTGIAGYMALAYTFFRLCTSIPGMVPPVYILFYCGLFLFTLGFMKWCFEAPFQEVLFAGVCGYATEHMAFAITTIFVELTGVSFSPVVEFFVVRFFPYIIMAAIIYWGIIRKNAGKGEMKNRDIRMVLLALAILLTAIIISVLVDQVGAGNSRLLQNVFCKLYAFICSMLAIFMAYFMSRQNRILRENEIMENMLHNMSEQQKLSRETINIINIKCHDLKYRISKISQIEDAGHQKEYIESVKGALAIYDNIFQTGNEALDLVLTEKSLLCSEYNIKLSSMVDGSVLNFMNTTDVYALFGNLLDNAIECVMKETDEEKRIISLSVNRKNQGSYIHAENYCNEPVVFEDGLPVTTKKDKDYHGFGVRSIRYLVDKYKGTVLMREEEKRFLVDIMFFPED